MGDERPRREWCDRPSGIGSRAEHDGQGVVESGTGVWHLGHERVGVEDEEE